VLKRSANIQVLLVP